jgi:SAM-dependent methyltransferase
MAEQAPFKRLVVGSSPTRLTSLPRIGAVDHRDHVALLREGVPPAADGNRRWADLGSGTGAFTLALADLLGPGGSIISVDRDAGGLARQADAMRRRFPDVALEQRVADFMTDLGESPFDGIVMANALHFQSDRDATVRHVLEMLRPGGRFVLVEYDADRGNAWVPYPLSFGTWRAMAVASGFAEPTLLGKVPSRFLSAIYSSLAIRPDRVIPPGQAVAALLD